MSAATWKKTIGTIFFGLVCLSLLTPFLVFKDLLFPFVTSKAFYFRIVIELALPLYAYLIFVDGSLRPKIKNPLNIAVVLFLVASFIAALLGGNVLKSVFGNFERMGGAYYLAHLTLLYFYLVLLAQMGGNYLQKFLKMLVAVGTLCSLDAVMVWLSHNHFLLNDPSYPRVSGSFGNPIFIASFLVIPMFVAAFFALGAEKLGKKIFYYILAALQLWAIFLSGTRGAIVGLEIGLFVGAVLFVAFNKKSRLKIYGGAAIAVFLVGLGLLFAFHNRLPPDSMLKRLFSLKDGNTQARLVQWKTALTGFKDAPIFGTGPESYYVISNKYYNPEIYNYDKSWFDKPHNYLLEVLVTTGIAGMLAYLAMLVFSGLALYRGFRKELLSLAEFCLLIAGLIVYEIQNLFVFDTVSASIAFFVFVGFCGYLLQETSGEAKSNSVKTQFLPNSFVVAVSLFTALAAAVLIFVTNYQGLKVAKNVNYGYAYGAVDAEKSENYFETARFAGFNFDPAELASKYADVAMSAAQSSDRVNPALGRQMLQNAIAAEESSVLRVPNDPISWQNLANLYITKSVVEKTSLDPRAQEAANKALALAPLRPEPQMLQTRIFLFQNNIAGAEQTLQNLLKTIPKEFDAVAQLALVYHYTAKDADGAALIEKALNEGFVPHQASEIAWVGDYYAKQGKFADAVRIYELATTVEPNNINVYWSLALVYPKVGQKDKAIAIAQAIERAEPSRTKEMEDFIASLK